MSNYPQRQTASAFKKEKKKDSKFDKPDFLSFEKYKLLWHSKVN